MDESLQDAHRLYLCRNHWSFGAIDELNRYRRHLRYCLPKRQLLKKSNRRLGQKDRKVNLDIRQSKILEGIRGHQSSHHHRCPGWSNQFLFDSQQHQEYRHRQNQQAISHQSDRFQGSYHQNIHRGPQHHQHLYRSSHRL